MLRLVEKKEVVVYRQQTNCTWGKNCFVFRLRCSVACSKFCRDFFLVFASVTPIFIVYFFLGTAVSRRFKTSNNQEFFFTPSFHNIFLFFFQFRMNNQLINICLFVFNSSFSSEISHYRLSCQSCRFSAKIKDTFLEAFLEAVEAVVISRVKDHQRLLRMMLLLQVHLTIFF